MEAELQADTSSASGHERKKKKSSVGQSSSWSSPAHASAGSGSSAHTGAIAHSGGVTCVVLELTGSQQVLVSGGRDATVRLWSVFNNQLLSTLNSGQQQRASVRIG